MELYDAIYSRRIVRDFKEQTVPDDILEKNYKCRIASPNPRSFEKLGICHYSG